MKPRNIPDLGLHQPDGSEDAGQPGGGVFTYGRFEKNIREAPARALLHRHDFHEIAIFDQGDGNHLADFAEHWVESPCALLIPSGTVHHWPDAERLRGDIIAFDLEFLGATSRNRGPAAILRPPVPTVISLRKEAVENLQPALQRIREEWTENEQPARRHVLLACLSLLLVDCQREHQRGLPERKAADLLHANFLDLLDLGWKSGYAPKDYAAALNISADHLSATLRQATGKNTSELIQERVLLESRRLLAHSRLSVSEIAFQCGFEDPSYFTRVFKKHTGSTPKQFREPYVDSELKGG